MTEAVDDLAAQLAALLTRDPSAGFRKDVFEQLVLAYMSNDGSAWISIREVLKDKHVLKQYEPRIKKRALELEGIPSIGRPAESIMIKDVWDDAPVSVKAEPPPGWGIGENGMAIYRKEVKSQDGQQYERKVCVSYDPIFVEKWIQHVDAGTVLLKLAWKVGRKWYSGIYDRDSVFSTRDIVRAARDGAPVGSDNAMEVVQWLRAYEHSNLRDLDIGYATSSMGWKGSEGDPTKHGFICGTRQLGGNGKAFQLRTLGTGDEAEAAAIRTRGTLQGWKDSIARCQKWPIIRVMLYASLAAPLLTVLDAPNAIIESVGRTSTGKTQALRIAQSVWRSSSIKPSGWNNTLNNFESKAHLFSGIPLFLDDTKLVVKQKGGEEMLGKAVYQYVSGSGRGRDTKDGGQRLTLTWRSILISTGENPSSDLANAEGAAARILSFWGSPAGKTSDETGALIDDLVDVQLHENYGHAGPALVEWMLENRERWDDFRAHYDRITSFVRQKFRTPAAARLARVVALLEMTSILAHEAGLIPWTWQSLLEDEEIAEIMGASLDQASQGADQARQAWEAMIAFAESRPSQWVDWGSEPKTSNEPSGGWLGWRDEREGKLAWLPTQLRRALKDFGFVPDTVLRAWRDEGVLDISASKKQRTFSTGVRCGAAPGDERPKLRQLVVVKILSVPWSDDLVEDEHLGTT